MSVIFSSNITLNTQPGDVANRPRILVDNVFQKGTVTASSEVGADNGWLENAVDGGTYDWWEWTATPAWLEVTLSTAQPVDMCAIGLHTGLTFVYQYWDGAAWVDLHDTVTTTTTAVHAVIFAEVTASKYRIYISAVDDENILGIVMLGKSLQFPKTFHGGHAPITLNRTTQIVRNRTENGFDAGVYSLRTGAATSVEINNIKPNWIRDNLELLNKDLEIRPFIFAWRPSTYPNDVAYCWLNSPITANNSGPKDYMSIRFDVQAFVGGGVIADPIEYVAVAMVSAPGLVVYNYTTSKQVTEAPEFASGCTAVAFSNDGTLLAVARDGENSIRIYSAITWELVANLGAYGVVGDIAFNVDGEWLGATTNAEDHNPILFKLIDGNYVEQTVTEQATVAESQKSPCTFDRSGTFFYMGDIIGDPPGTYIRIYSLTPAVSLASTISDERAANCMSINPDNQLAAGSEGNFDIFRSFSVYNAAGAKVYDVDAYNTKSIAYNRQGNKILYGNQGEFNIIGSSGFSLEKNVSINAARCTFSRVDNKVFAASQGRKAIVSYDATNWSEQKVFTVPNLINGVWRIASGALRSSWPATDPIDPPAPPIEPIDWGFWIDASAEGALTLSGSDVTQWNDISGNANHVVQADGALMPTTTTINSLTAVQFAGLERMTHSYGQTESSQTTTFCVLIAGAQTGFRGIFSPASGAGSMFLARSSTSANYGTFLSSYMAAGSSVISAGTTCIAMQYESAGNLTSFFRDGSADGTQTSKGTIQTGHVGGILGQEFQGTICEIRVAHRLLTTDEIDRTFGELAHKWGFEASLPAEHPYKDAPP